MSKTCSLHHFIIGDIRKANIILMKYRKYNLHEHTHFVSFIYIGNYSKTTSLLAIYVSYYGLEYVLSVSMPK